MSKTNFKKPTTRRKRSSLGDVPPGNETPIIENLHKKSSTSSERINILIPPEKKRELKMWAAMHDKDMTTILLEGLELWKNTYIKS